MLFAPVGIDFTVRWRAPRGPVASPTVEIRDEGGAARIGPGTAAAPGLEGVATTLSGAHAAGVTALTLAAGQGTPGKIYRLGPNAAGQSEDVKFRGRNGTAVTLFGTGLRYAYAGGEALVGTEISHTIAASFLAVPYKNWQAIFSWKIGAVDQPAGQVRFDITRLYVAEVPATISDLELFDPSVTRRVPTSPAYDWDGVMRDATDEVLRDVNSSMFAGGLLLDDDWKTLVVLKTLLKVAMIQGSELAVKQVEQWRKEYLERLRTLKAQASVDENQDKAISPNEKNRGRGGLRQRG